MFQRTIDLTSDKKYKLYLSDHAPSFSTDALILSDSITVSKSCHIADIGSGTGIIPFLIRLLNRESKNSISGFEIEKELVKSSDYTAQSTSLFENINFYEFDLKCSPNKNIIKKFDIVVSNPPYYADSQKSFEPSLKYRMKNETHTKLFHFLKFAADILKTRGVFHIILTASRLFETLDLAKKLSLNPIQIRAIHPAPNENSHIFTAMFLKETFKPDFKIMPPLLIRNSDGSYSDEMKKIYARFGF